MTARRWRPRRKRFFKTTSPAMGGRRHTWHSAIFSLRADMSDDYLSAFKCELSFIEITRYKLIAGFTVHFFVRVCDTKCVLSLHARCFETETSSRSHPEILRERAKRDVYVCQNPNT